MVMSCLGCAVLATLLAVPRPAAQNLSSRLAPQSRASVADARGASRTRRRSWTALAIMIIVPGTIIVLASYLRVGQVPSAALAIAAADCEVLRKGHQAHTLGGDVVHVWRQQARLPGHGGLLELGRAWQVSVETGAPMSSTLDQVAASLSADQALAQVINSELAAARATSKVMAALPPCGIGIGYLLGGDPAGWLLDGPAGWACLLAGTLLACAGVLWIEALARRASADG